MVFAALVAGLIVLPGCVTRTFTITSEPAGAEVRLDGKLVGTTPFTETFYSYGVRRVEVRKDGYQRVIVEHELERPWWQYFPINFITELFWPPGVVDEHGFDARLLPQTAGSFSWQDAQNAYAQFRSVRDVMDARAARFSGHSPDEPGAGSQAGGGVQPGSEGEPGVGEPTGSDPIEGDPGSGDSGSGDSSSDDDAGS